MIDREKVIKALTECIFLHEHPDDDAGCLECPYRPDEKGTCPTMIPFLKDVLELLKEQEPVKPERRYVSEPDKRFDKYRCTACDDILIRYRQHYCGSCGRELKWDD